MAIPKKIFGFDTKLVGLALVGLILVALGGKHDNWLDEVGLFVIIIGGGWLVFNFFR